VHLVGFHYKEYQDARSAKHKKIETLVGSHASNFTVHNGVHKNPLLAHVLILMQPSLTIPSHFFHIHFNLILPSNLGFLTKDQDALPFSACYVQLTSHPP
jgi:hypothetical protein